MKKAIALLATLVVFTGTTFAQLAPTITASAETKWGVNLDKDNASGFENDVDVTVIVPLTTEGAENVTSSSKIALTGVELSINVEDGAAEENEEGDIEAKLLFGNAFVALGNNEGLEFNFADSSMDYYDVHSSSTGFAGINFGYVTDLYNFTVNVNTPTGYDTDDGTDDEITSTENDLMAEVDDETDQYKSVNEDNEYNYGVNVGVTLNDMFNLEVALATKNKKDVENQMVLGGKVYGTVMDSLTYALPVDYYTNTPDGGDALTAMELYPNVSYSKNGITGGLGFYMLTLDKGLQAEVAENDPVTLDGKAYTHTFKSISNLTDDAEFQILTFNLGYGADMFNVALNSEITLTEGSEEQEFTVTADVTPVAGAKLYTEVTYSVDAEKTELGNVGLELTSALTGIENTVFTIQYEGMVRVDGADEDGIFFVGAKITL